VNVVENKGNKTMTTNTETVPAVEVAPKFATRDQYEAVIKELDLTFTEQSGFLKVEAAKGRRVYVAATKSVRRVDLSGWEATGSLAVPHRLGKFGQVTQMMNLEGTPDEQIITFRNVLVAMKQLTAVEKAPKAPKAKKEKGAKKTWGTPQAPAPTTQTIADRLELIKKVAAEKGMSVSSKTLAQASE